jgi:nitrate reductase gamma subunit
MGNTTQVCGDQASFIMSPHQKLSRLSSRCGSHIFWHCQSIGHFSLHLRRLATKNTRRTTNTKDMLLLLFEKEIYMIIRATSITYRNSRDSIAWEYNILDH